MAPSPDSAFPELHTAADVRLFRTGLRMPDRRCFLRFRTKASEPPSKGYTYPDNTAYYHYNKPLSQSQDFGTVFVIIDKSGTLKLCNPTKKNPVKKPVPASGKIFHGILGSF